MKNILSLSIVTVVVIIIIWVFTKSWLIPNYTWMEILCSKNNINTNIEQKTFTDKVNTVEDDNSGTNIKEKALVDTSNLPIDNNTGAKIKEESFTQNYDFYKNEYKEPVIYLYPKQKQEIRVELNFKGEVFARYPEYNIKNWRSVISDANSNIIDTKDNKQYSYLFWEWISSQKIIYDTSKWFVVKWSDVREFLQNILPELWLLPKEYNEFIVYRYPKMMNNKYNWIYFAGKEYTDNAKLDIIPKPDSILRVFMVTKPLDYPIKIQEQKFDKFERKGFSVVERWWTEIK